jgi:hypothetical protein
MTASVDGVDVPNGFSEGANLKGKNLKKTIPLRSWRDPRLLSVKILHWHLHQEFYLDDSDAVKWWWRIAARRDWGLQGWMRNKVYPDFLVHLDANRNIARLLVLETKGKHLEGSADTEFKTKFFELLEAAYTSGKEAGEVELFVDRPDAMRFRILIQEKKAWEPELEKVLRP